MEDDVISAVKQFLQSRRLLKSSAEVADEESLLETGVIDSLGVVELTAFMEERFSIRIDEDDLVPENFDSLLAMREFINRKRSQGSAR